jgi:hypothetical protein
MLIPPEETSIGEVVCFLGLVLCVILWIIGLTM